ncbi:MAG: TonB-dependent receptor [Fimbriimonadaceae bacterium]|nr:TonB-dependent receptor [Chitinophagales bacterium]
MKELNLTLIITFFISSFTFAQNNGTLKGEISDKQTQLPIEFATVSLLNAADSSIAGGTLTDSTGSFLLQEITAGNYITKISFIGYADHFSEKFSVNNNSIDIGIIALQTSDNALNAITVVGEKKIVETIPGGIVYHADQVLTNANSTVLDMMKGVPNIIVDKDEHVSIRGNTGINVMIDDVPLNLSGDDLTNFLKQLPANMISAVEVITTPGAKYDAAGSAGIINLKTKQTKASGKNGTLNAGAETLGSWNVGGNYFSNSEKIRFNASYNFNHNYFESTANGHRENYLNPEPLYLYDEVFTQDGAADNHLGKIGLDYIINEKNTVGGSVSYGNDNGSFGINDVLYAKYIDGTVSGSYNSILDYNYDGDNYSGNLHYIKKFAKQGEDVNFDANYSHYSHNNTIPSETNFFDADGNMIEGLTSTRNDATDFGVDIYTGKIDYVLPIKETSKLELGLKNTFTSTENNLHAQVIDIISGEWINDSTVSNDFRYQENVSAAYISFSGAIKKLNYTLGLRSEYTNINTESATAAAAKSDDYIDFFPSGNLKYTLKKGGELSFDYSRRIERPVYQWLNPFVDKSTPYTWFTGNPDLKPYYTNSLSLSYSKFIQMKHYLMASIFYQDMDNIFTQYFEYAGDGVYYLTVKNVNNQTNVGASFMIQSPVTKWFDLLLNLSVYQNSIDNELSGVDLDSKISASTYASATIKFWKNTSFQLTGNYMSPSTNPQGYFDGFYSVDAGIKKSFINDKLSVNINVKDIFNSMKFTNEFVDETFSSTYTFKPISRIAGISLSWRFGDAMQNMMQEQKSEEERRVNFGGRNG